MHKSQWFAGVLLAIFACGDDDSSGDAGPASSAAATCAKGCARASAAKCPNQPASCQQLCEDDIRATPAGCIAFVNGYAECINSAVFSCDSTGVAEARTCSAQLAAWQACAGGVLPTPDASVRPVADAAMSFPDTAVPDAAVVDAAITDAALADASVVPDSGLLQCPAQPGDAPCDTCLEAFSCVQIIQCDASCGALSDCASNCPDEDDGSCAAYCQQLYPAGVPPLRSLLQCLETSCTPQCVTGEEAATSNSRRGLQLRSF